MIYTATPNDIVTDCIKYAFKPNRGAYGQGGDHKRGKGFSGF